MDKQSINDIRIKLTVPNIYEAFAINTTHPIQDNSKEIRLPFWNINNAIVKISIYTTNTIAISIGCSREPFALDYNGIMAFFGTLREIRGFLVGIMLSIYSNDINNHLCIPSLSDWLITMWHFGRDSLIEVSGKRLSYYCRESKLHNREGLYKRFWKWEEKRKT